MTKRTLSNKGRYSVLKVSGFRARMATPQGRKTIRIDVKKVENFSDSSLILKLLELFIFNYSNNK
jgi:ribosomal protein L34